MFGGVKIEEWQREKKIDEEKKIEGAGRGDWNAMACVKLGVCAFESLWINENFRWEERVIMPWMQMAQ